MTGDLARSFRPLAAMSRPYLRPAIAARVALLLSVISGPLSPVAAAGPGGHAIPDGEWAGEWDPGDSCLDTRERRITARTEDGHIAGRVLKPPSTAGVFAADISGTGRFTASVVGLARYGINLTATARPDEITGVWTGQQDCGSGSFVLRPVAPEPAAPATTPTVTHPAPSPIAPPVAERLPWLRQPDLMAAPSSAPDRDQSARAALATLYRKGVISERELREKLAALDGTRPRARPEPRAAPPLPRPAPPRLLLAPVDPKGR